jgi:hypothetical protein
MSIVLMKTNKKKTRINLNTEVHRLKVTGVDS